MSEDTNRSRAFFLSIPAFSISSINTIGDEDSIAVSAIISALDLLVSSDKIVLMATHDPTLAILADRRIIISNGGIADIIETSQTEKGKLKELEEMDQKIQEMRRALRFGERLQ